MNRGTTIAIALPFVWASSSLADAPDIRTPSPVIYLADNLDEKDQLGWCIDTLGRGFAERLQAHSCKPQGGDVQFRYGAPTGTIQSVAYPEFCMAYAPNDASDFALVTCDSTDAAQRFGFDAGSGQITPQDAPTQCVVVGENSRSAGPFMSRALTLAPCDVTPDALKKRLVVL